MPFAASQTIGNLMSSGDVTVLFGVHNSDFLGRTITSAGDINGDGIEDFIVSANGLDFGGSNAGGCNPPPYPMPVDWIFGHEMVTFSNWVRDEGPLVRRTTDHPMIRATATLDGLDGLPPASQ